MLTQSWHPVVPSHYLRPGDNIVAGAVEGQELALWRSKSGSVQAWENRCPHRGTRFTMGRILNDHLSCAYHGWEFAPEGKCVAIPANPSLPIPKQLCAKHYGVTESGGMVWVTLGDAAASQPKPDRSPGSFFCRSLSLRADVPTVESILEQKGFERVASADWRGTLCGLSATALLNVGEGGITFAHVWLAADPNASQLSGVLAELRLLRRGVERLATSWSQA